MDWQPIETVIERAYQHACTCHLIERQNGRDAEVFFAAACAIEDAWPAIIEAYCVRTGAREPKPA